MIRLYDEIRLKYYVTELIGIILMLFLITIIYGKTGNTLLFILGLIITISYIIFIAIYYTKEASKKFQEFYEKIEKNKLTKEDKKELERLEKRVKNKELKEWIRKHTQK